jgi:hypothetical protein
VEKYARTWLLIFTPGNMVASMMSTEPGLLEKAAMEEWFYGKARPLERMSALECGSRLANVRSGCAPWKGGAFQWVQVPPGDRSSRKQPEQAWR